MSAYDIDWASNPYPQETPEERELRILGADGKGTPHPKIPYARGYIRKQRDGTWFYKDEHESTSYGPFDTAEEAMEMA